MAYNKKTAKKKILFEMESVPVALRVCASLGIPRSTYYRWIKEDPEFKENIEFAKSKGRETITELAETAIMQKISEGDFQASKYWLENHEPRYIKPRGAFKPPQAVMEQKRAVVVFVGKGEQFKTVQEFEEYENRNKY